MSRRWLVAVGTALATVGLFGFAQTIVWDGSPEYTATIATQNPSDIRSCGVITCSERELRDVASEAWWIWDERHQRTEIIGPRRVKFRSRTTGRDKFFGLWEYSRYHDTHAVVRIEFADGERWAGVVELPDPRRSRSITIDTTAKPR